MDITARFQELIQSAILFVPRLIVALIIFFASLPLSGVAARAAERAARLRTKDPEILRLLKRLARWSVLVLGTVIALQQVNFDLTGFVAGLGIAGFTLGIALQDIARNFVAGILLLVQQPFNVGDAIKVSGFTGTVVDVSIRDTVIRTWDGETVILPNHDVYTSAITNYSQLANRRRTVTIGLGYEEDVGRALLVFAKTISGVEGVLAEPAPTVHVEALGDSALTVAARFWLNQETHSLLDVHSSVVTAIKEVAETEGISLPYPIQTVRLENAPNTVEQ
jgi:small conductance mechanosensitive channel